MAGRPRSVCSYPHLVREVIAGNPDEISDADLAQASRAILDRLHAEELGAIRQLFESRAAEGRATTDVVQAARAATFGAVAVLLVDIDEVVPGRVALRLRPGTPPSPSPGVPRAR